MNTQEQEQRNINAFNEFANEYPQAIGTLNNKRTIAFAKANGDEAIIYSTGTYIKKERGRKSAPITSGSVHNSIVILVQDDYNPVRFNSISLTRGRDGINPRVMRQTRRPQTKGLTSSRMGHSELMEQYYGSWGPTPARYSGIIRDYNDSFASLEKSFDALESKGFVKRKRSDML